MYTYICLCFWVCGCVCVCLALFIQSVLAGPSYSEEPGPLLWHTPSQGEEDWALLLSHLGRGSIFWCRGPPALLHLCTLNIIVTIHRK